MTNDFLMLRCVSRDVHSPRPLAMQGGDGRSPLCGSLVYAAPALGAALRRGLSEQTQFAQQHREHGQVGLAGGLQVGHHLG